MPELMLALFDSHTSFCIPCHHLQVELNTIASSFGCLSALTTRLHNYIASRVTVLDGSRLPTNNAIEGIPAGLAAAAKAHGAAGGVVVMVVQPGERNAYDQQWLQLQLWEQHGVRTLRCTLREIADEAQLGAGGAMTIRGHPVSVVYFRAGYTPNDYPSEVEWQAREVIERSNAAKCPTVAYQLAGAKKVQQDLARPGVLERFTDSEQVRSRMTQVLADTIASSTASRLTPVCAEMRHSTPTLNLSFAAQPCVLANLASNLAFAW